MGFRIHRLKIRAEHTALENELWYRVAFPSFDIKNQEAHILLQANMYGERKGWVTEKIMQA